MIGILVKNAILLKRAQECDHVWSRLNDIEEQCQKCTVIVTEAGKKHLERFKKRGDGT